MRILIVITGLGVGGAERMVTNLADRFVAEGHQVVVVTLHGSAELCPSDDEVRMLGLGMTKSPCSIVASLARLRRLIKEFAPDVVNSHLVHANLLTRLLRLITPMPYLVSSAHNTNEGSRARMIAYRLTDGLADISTNVSEEAVRAFVDQGALRARCMVAIHNGIDVKAFIFDGTARQRLRDDWGVRDTDTILLAVGRLRPQKDYPNLLSALARLREGEGYPRLLIVGEGPQRKELEALAVSLGVDSQVHFLGVRNDVPALMSACDVFVLSSAWEGFGLVVAEAMACERVVVATDSGGVREVVGDVGVLVPPRDSNALAEALAQTLAMSRSQRGALGGLGRARVVECYSLQATASRYLSVFQGNVGEAHSSGGDRRSKKGSAPNGATKSRSSSGKRPAKRPK